MLLNFKQGIIQADPGFIAAGGQFVSLVVSGNPVSFTICSSTKSYTYIEQETVTAAWGPIFTGVDQWLYWDINTLTAERTFGVTLFQPVVSGVAPIAPAIDQHWFDTSAQVMKVWSGSIWNTRLRVFACKLSNGAIPQSMSINAPDFTGTQVGITAPEAIFATGEILFDAQTGQPLRIGSGYFATTVDPLTTGNLSSESIIISSAIVPAQLTANVGASTVVEFTDYGTVSPANQFTAALGRVYGLVTQGALMDTVVNVVTAGPVTNDLWDFSVPGAGGLEPGMPPFARFPDPCPVNTLLYSDSTGQLTAIPGQTPVAIVTGRRSILMGSPQIRNTGTTNIATASTYGIVQLNIPPAVPGTAIVVGDNDPRLDALGDISNKVNRTGDTMTGILTLVGNPVDPLDSVPKQYVDAADSTLNTAITTGLALKLDLAGGTLLGSLTLNADPVFPLEAATKQYVDNTTTGFVPLTGGTMSGFLVLNADPFSNLQAATKQYVDNAVAGVSISQPDTQLVYGTGAGIGSSPSLVYEALTGRFAMSPPITTTPGDIELFAAGGLSPAGGGNVFIYGGSGIGGGIDANGGAVDIGGGAGRGAGTGGYVRLTAGSTNTGGDGGPIIIEAGTAGIGGNGGTVNITGGNIVVNQNGSGGDVSIQGGTVNFVGGTGNVNGGDVILSGGVGNGTGVHGSIKLNFGVDGALELNGTPGTVGQVLTSNGPAAAPTWQTPSGSGTVTSVDASGGTTGLTFGGGPVTTSGTLTLSGTLGIANGGTGLTSITSGLTLLSANISGTSLLYRNVFGQGGVSVFWSDTPTPQVTIANQVAAKFAITKTTTDSFTTQFVGGSFYDMYEWNMNNVGLSLDFTYNGGNWILGPFSFPTPGLPIGPFGVNLNDFAAQTAVWTTQFNLQFTSAFSGFPVGSFMTVFASSMPAFGYLREFSTPMPTFTLADGSSGPSTSFTCTLPNLPGGTSNILWKVRLFVPTTGIPNPTLQPLAGSMTLVWAA